MHYNLLMKIDIIPVLTDNYAYVIQSGNQVGVIDPGEADPVLVYLDSHHLKPDWVINTHRHGDHMAGNAAILNRFDAKLAAPAECKNDPDLILKNGDDFPFGDIVFKIHETKGHTQGHIILFDPTYRILFAGDTLFSMGCGRVLEGTMEDMYQSLQLIKSFPPETAIYCGHEYTHAHADFASHILPDNIDIKKRRINLTGKTCTMPTTLAVELTTNPFLLAKDLNEFTIFRKAKDRF